MINVCAKCQAQYQPKMQGVTVVETSGTPPKAARLWNADLLACPICGALLISHFGHEPMESHEPGFDKVLAEIPPGRKYILHSPELLTQRLRHETTYVRPYGTKTNLRTTDR